MHFARSILVRSSVALAALVACACQPQTPATKAPDTPVAPPAAPAQPAATAATAEPAMGDFKGLTGTVTEVEDAGYPMSALKIDLGDGKPPLSLLYNNEEAQHPADANISDFKGKRVLFDYSRKPELDLIEVKLDGKDLLSHQPGDPVVKPEATVTGKLSGATELSGGDLPDTITVTDAAGKAFDFPIFISDKALVAANGKQVTAGYQNDVREDITAIKLAPPK